MIQGYPKLFSCLIIGNDTNNEDDNDVHDKPMNAIFIVCVNFTGCRQTLV